MNKKIINLIKSFEKKHKAVAEEDGNTDCSIRENEIFRVAPRKEWLGDDESWKKAIQEQKQKDKYIKCYVCEFIKKLKGFA